MRVDLITGFAFFLLGRLNESKFSGHGEMGHGAVYDELIKPILEEVLFHGNGIVKIGDVHFREMHDGADVELVDPMGRLAYA